MTIYVLSGFNNYYNRIVKKFDTINEYEPYVLHIQQNYNFVPNDSVNTQVVLGSNVNLYDGTGDYLLAVNEFNEIVSRWFIIESVRDRAGQYTLTLHRDLIADHYNELLDAPMFIEKATLTVDDPLIYNNEQMTFNQIKTNETLLYDKTGKSWIVGYIAPDAQDIWKTYATFDGTFNEPMTNYDYLVDKVNQGNIKVFKNYALQYNGINDYTSQNSDGKRYVHTITLDKDNYSIQTTDTTKGADSKLGAQITNRSKLVDVCNGMVIDTRDNSVIKANLLSLFGLQEIDLTQFNGRIVINNETGIFYRVNVTQSALQETETYYTSTITNTNMQNIKAEMLQIVRKQDYIQSNTPSTQYLPHISAKGSYAIQKVTLTEINDKGINVQFRSTAKQATDAPYYMFAIPYSENNLRLAIQIGTLLGSNLYDMQLMPYCPVQNYFYSDGTPNITSLTEGTDYEPIKQNEIVVDYLFWCPFTNITFDIPFQINVPINAVEKKIQAQCDMWRLCSPNGNGEFQFNVAKNNGVSRFNIDCTYRPINPYVHLNPDFGGLYGYDSNDFRGLILQGDFSIPLLSDQWVNYEINNKNYQNSFNRQIENLEIQQKMGRVQDIVGSITGIGTGAAAGGLAGSSIMPGAGVGIGASIGAGLNVIGGLADYAINEQLRKEAIDYTVDNFGYQLGNIQARPQSIVKTGCLTYNNKKVPYIEYYTCTDKEKTAFVNKLAYNGMTTMVIGTIREYKDNEWSYGEINDKGYIKGQLIKLETVEDDYHIINAIGKELYEGVYLRGE